MTIRINNKITGYSVVRPEDATPVEAAKPADTSAATEREKAKVIQMHEKLERPDTLRGTTYKIKTPLTEHALGKGLRDEFIAYKSEEWDAYHLTVSRWETERYSYLF